MTMNKIQNTVLLVSREIEMKAVWWDGSFRQAEELRRHGLFEGMQVSTHDGHLSYTDLNGRLRAIPRDVFVVRDGDEIKHFYNSGDSLLSNHYRVSGLQES